MNTQIRFLAIMYNNSTYMSILQIIHWYYILLGKICDHIYIPYVSSRWINIVYGPIQLCESYYDYLIHAVYPHANLKSVIANIFIT